jgi:hypothetical protein
MKKVIKIYFSLFTISLFLLPLAINAQNEKPNLKDAFGKATDSPLQTVAGSQGAGYLASVGIETLAGQVITALTSLLGVIFVLLTIYGGFLYMNARGNEEQTKKAKAIITQALIGLVIILAAYAISYFILKFLI